MSKLMRFITAQKGNTMLPSFEKAYNEIKQGTKTGHWIWYIFPQFKALGRSSTAKYYGIENFEEACDYLQKEELFKNYYAISQCVLERLNQIPVQQLMGSEIDANKLVSSLTLFREAAAFLAETQASHQNYKQLVKCCDQIFKTLECQNYFICKSTLALINNASTTSELPSETNSQIKSPPIKPTTLQNYSVFTKPLELSTSPPARDYSVLSKALENYIDARSKEWSFHYNFLGIMSVIYWLHDAVWGTDYLNNKSREVKVRAATYLKQAIDNKDCESINLSHAEKTALENDSLGDLVNSHGGLDNIMRSIKTEPHQNPNISKVC